ncbi:MAG: glycogen debranching N-terminal domain-containing protein [Balneolales bacterium]
MNKTADTAELIQNKRYTTAESVLTDDRIRTLNSADTFVVFDRWGDIRQEVAQTHGLFHEGTRFLSLLKLKLFDQQPALLNSSISMENDVLSVDLTNNEIFLDGELLIAKAKLHIERIKFVQNGIYYEKVQLYNHSKWKMDLKISFEVGSDFKDIFEVRGYKRKKRGEIINGEDGNLDRILLKYRGLDNVIRKTVINFEPQPDVSARNEVIYYIPLEPNQEYSIINTIKCLVGDKEIDNPGYHNGYNQILGEQAYAKENIASIDSSHESFNHWVKRSRTDLIALTTDTPHGKYPYAGVPWFNTAFGRDGIITAYETLWAAPDIARGVLSFLVDRQSKHTDDFHDAEPGKIMHEARSGEMADLKEVPYKLYYGTVDATPLFIILAGAYYKRTADMKFIKAIWPNIEAALKWIDDYGDLDNDGFVEYHHKSKSGLFNQGWKDADNAIHHADGKLADSPIALCEVQGYVYDAKIKAAGLAQAMGLSDVVVKLESQAHILKKRFNTTFWDDELGTFILALDKDKNPCRVKTSNAGQCLFSGIVDEKYAPVLAETLLSDEMASGWGIRTLATDARRYNPMSYHNGTVWPHDNALIAFGLARYGFRDKVVDIMSRMFEATFFLELQRLPELYCGFDIRRGQGPTPYPVACSPQAWSVAVVYMMVQSCLNMEIDALERKVYLVRPLLPPFTDTLEIKNIRIGNSRLALNLYRYKTDVGIDVIEKDKNWEVIVIK